MKRRIVLDTNCLLQIVSQHCAYYCVWEHYLCGSYYLCVSNDILEEYEEIIGQKTSPQVARMLIELILRSPYTLRFDAHFRWGLITKDPDDNKFVDCAIVANAEYIVTEDSHFNVLQNIPFPKVPIIRLKQFADLLMSVS